MTLVIFSKVENICHHFVFCREVSACTGSISQLQDEALSAKRKIEVLRVSGATTQGNCKHDVTL